MLPFAPLPGRLQAWAPSDPSLQQPLALPNRTHSTIPPFSILGAYNADLSRSGASNVAAAVSFPGPTAPLSCPNLPHMMENNQASIPPVLLLQHVAPQSLNQQHLPLQLLRPSRGAPGNLQQFQGQFQSPSVVNLMQPGVSCLANNLPRKFNFGGAMPNVYSLSPQTMMIQENQIGYLNSNALSQPQVHLFEVTGRVIEPKDCQRKSFHKNALKHKQTELRCQKQQFENSKRMKTNTERTGEIVVKKRREGKPQCAMNIQSSLRDSQRRCPIKYTEKQIQKWVKARRKKFPTRHKTEKKLARGGVKGGAKLHFQQPKVVLARRAELGVQIPKLPRPCRSKSKFLAGTKVNSSRALKMTDKFPNKEPELGVEVGDIPPGCLCEPKHQDSRVANNSEVLKMTGNIRKRRERRPSIRMVDSPRELKRTGQFPNKEVELGAEIVELGRRSEPKHHRRKEVNNSVVLKMTDINSNKSNKKRKITRQR